MGPSWYLAPDIFEHFFKLMGERDIAQPDTAMSPWAVEEANLLESNADFRWLYQANHSVSSK
ncbi:hypothetical protein BH24ACI3_BH24ACI3_06010 [soil metagenome]